MSRIEQGALCFLPGCCFGSLRPSFLLGKPRLRCLRKKDAELQRIGYLEV